MHENLRNAFAKYQVPLPKQMKYTAQVIWVLDPQDAGMTTNGRVVHAKRAAASEVNKSQVVYGTNPKLNRALLEEARADIRLYVCGHGVTWKQQERIVKFGIRTGTPLNDANLKDAKEFCQMLDEVIQQMPQRRVRRISLDMCNSAGIESEIPLKDSFAAQLAICCRESTTDVTGRRGIVRILPRDLKKEDADEVFKSYGGQNVFYNYEEADRTGILGAPTNFITNARKVVRRDQATKEDQVEVLGTYIFTPDGKWERKRDKAT
jgi:hypothetical protein